jgi:hypothetical protein
VELPRDCTLIVHVEGEASRLLEESVLQPVLVPWDPDAARRLISEVE